MENDIVVEEFDKSKVGFKIPIICVYNKPQDYPKHYAARLWDGETPTNIVALSESLAEIRKLKPVEMISIRRHQMDDAAIEECWI